MKLLLLLECCGFVWGQPIFAVFNAAGAGSFSGYVPAGFAPGSLIQAGYLPNTQSPPPALDPVTVSLQLLSPSANGPINLSVLGSASSSSVLALVPASVPLGPGILNLLVNGVEQASTQTTVLSTDLGIFTTTGLRAIAQNTLPDGTVVTNALTTPAVPDGFVTLWGTGLGNATTQDVSATIGGRPAIVTYAGHSATPGLDQINIQIPDDSQIPQGCYVAVEANVPLEYGGNSLINTSNPASISLASKGAPACTHPLNLTLQEMQTLDQGGTIPLLNMGLRSLVGATGSNGLVSTRSDDAGVSLTELDSEGMASSSGAMLEAPSALFGCQGAAVSLSRGGKFYGGTSAGAALTLSGPSGQTLSLPAGTVSYAYAGAAPPSAPASSPDAVASSFFVPGTWTLSAPGSSAVAPFSIPLSVTPAIRITNTAALAEIDASQDLVVTWDTQGLRADQMITVNLLSTIPCTAPALQGSLTIPSALVAAGAQLPVAPGPWLEVELSPQPGIQSNFRVPLTNGTSMPGVLTQTSWEDVPTVIEPFAPAIFPGAVSNQDGTANSASNGAAPGSTIAVWATGLSGNVTVTALIGGETVVNPSYAGPAPGLPGVQQVNLTIPPTFASGTTMLSLCRTPANGSRVCSPPVPLTIQ